MENYELVEKIGYCVARGKVNTNAPYPKDKIGQEGPDELTKKRLKLLAPRLNLASM